MMRYCLYNPWWAGHRGLLFCSSLPVLIIIIWFSHKTTKRIAYWHLSYVESFKGIRKLKGEFEGYYRYKIGNYRLFYLINNEQVLIVIVELKHRQNAYK
ncbi:MAG: type II toxin-antitoxin system RelE/ParE family toxin [Bacteroidota bacterium]